MGGHSYWYEGAWGTATGRTQEEGPSRVPLAEAEPGLQPQT